MNETQKYTVVFMAIFLGTALAIAWILHQEDMAAQYAKCMNTVHSGYWNLTSNICEVYK